MERKRLAYCSAGRALGLVRRGSARILENREMVETSGVLAVCVKGKRRRRVLECSGLEGESNPHYPKLGKAEKDFFPGRSRVAWGAERRKTESRSKTKRRGGFSYVLGKPSTILVLGSIYAERRKVRVRPENGKLVAVCLASQVP